MYCFRPIYVQHIKLISNMRSAETISCRRIVKLDIINRPTIKIEDKIICVLKLVFHSLIF